MGAEMPAYYPVFLDLKGKHCVVFGGGLTAEGKIAKLHDAGAQITVISPHLTDSIQAAVQRGEMEWLAREYQPGDLTGAFLAIAATNVRSVNQSIFQEAEEQGVLLNVVDEPSQCNFISPATVNRGPVTVAISTSGASPALARKLRETLGNSTAIEWADLAGVMSQARQQLKKQKVAIDPEQWQRCLTRELLELAQNGREDEALTVLLSCLLDEDGRHLGARVDQSRPEEGRSEPAELVG